MAVVVQCYHCDTILELDEGFRGGVCRCSTCGSLLQVPKATGPAAGKARPAAPGASPTDIPRPSNPNADPGLSRGQFDPSNRSGIRPASPDLGGSSSGLRQARANSPTTTPTRPSKPEKVIPLSGPTQAVAHAKEIKKNNTMLLFAIGGGALLLLLIVIVIIAVVFTAGGTTPNPSGSGASGRPSPRNPDGTSTPTPPVVSGPNFLGIPLTGKQIVISVDSASSMQECFSFVLRGINNALPTLNDDQKIIVAVWQSDAILRLPESGFVDKKQSRLLSDALDNLAPRGATNAQSSMIATLQAPGDQIIFITAKYSLEESLAPAVLAVAGSQRIDAVKITAEDPLSPLEAITKKAQGKFLFLSQSELERAATR